jgi:sodium/potassium/calcium exchanger 4
LGISDSLMAVTFIAAGTSIPDAYTSIVVVKEGMVDMGVSNIIGSNVFDLLIGLALPWFIKAIFNNGYVTINSNGIAYDSLLLYACVIVTVLLIHFKQWNLDRRCGYVFLSVYSAFLIFSAAIELNMFSYVNPPMCS